MPNPKLMGHFLSMFYYRPYPFAGADSCLVKAAFVLTILYKGWECKLRKNAAPLLDIQPGEAEEGYAYDASDGKLLSRKFIIMVAVCWKIG
jgi:hypothetical protein